jgi:hypothetical protein
VPTSFRTAQPLRTKPSNGSAIFYSTKNDNLDDNIGFNNGILIAYGMCPPCELLVPRHELSD